MTKLFSRFTDWCRRTMPTRDQMEANRFIPESVMRGDLWRFTRRSVPRGVALGMFVGIMVPFAQIIFAALFSLPARANVPVAALTTFATNPFTTPLIWAFSYSVGAAMLPVDTSVLHAPINDFSHITDFWTLLQWVTAEGKVLAFGLLVVAVVASALSYLLASYGWTLWISRKRKVRLERAGRNAD